MADKNRRSKHYDYFTKPSQDQEPKNNAKRIVRRTLFVLKIFVYFILAGLALTGCIQSFVITNTTNVGQGIEISNSESQVTPFTSVYAGPNTADNVTLSVANKDGTKTVSTSTTSSTVERSNSTNYVVLDQSVIANLIQKATTDGGSYSVLTTSTHGVYTSALNLTDINDISYNTVTKNYYYNSSTSTFNSVGVTDQSNNSAAVFYVEDASGNKKYLYYNNTMTNYTSIYGDETFWAGLNNIYIVSQSPYSIVKASATTGTTSADNATISVPEAYLINVNLALGDSTTAVARYNRDVFYTLYLFLTSREEYFGSKTNVSASQLIDALQNPTSTVNDTTGVVTSNWALSAEQLVAYNAYIGIAQFAIDAGITDVVQANASTSGQSVATFNASSISNANNSFRNLGYSTRPLEALTTWDQAWIFGPFYALIIYPLGQLIAAITSAIGSSGWGVVLAIIIIVLLSRLLVFFLTYRGTFGQQRTIELNSRKAKIEAKYAQYDKANKVMMNRKRVELQQMYKKAGINQSDQLLSILYTTPLFLGVWRVIQSVPLIKANEIGGVNFATTSYQAILSDQQWQYLFVIILAVSLQLVSQILPRILTRRRLKQRTNAFEQEQLKKSNRMQNFVLIAFVIITVILQAGVQIYWIMGSIWTIGQTLFVHHIQKTKFYRVHILNHLQQERFARWKI